VFRFKHGLHGLFGLSVGVFILWLVISEKKQAFDGREQKVLFLFKWEVTSFSYPQKNICFVRPSMMPVQILNVVGCTLNRSKI
jgi:hypothetical protein